MYFIWWLVWCAATLLLLGEPLLSPSHSICLPYIIYICPCVFPSPPLARLSLSVNLTPHLPQSLSSRLHIYLSLSLSSSFLTSLSDTLFVSVFCPSVCLSLCFICPSVCLRVLSGCLFVCLRVLSGCLSVCLLSGYSTRRQWHCCCRWRVQQRRHR